MLPGIAHVHVEIDGDDQPLVFIVKAVPLCRSAQHRLDCAVGAAIEMPATRNLRVLIEIVKDIHQRVRYRKWRDRPFRKRAAHYVAENNPLVFTMKIVDDNEAAPTAQSRHC